MIVLQLFIVYNYQIFISDKLLDKCLYLADEFELPDLKGKCEDFLLLSSKLSAEEQFSFAVKHELPRLMKDAVLRIHNGNEIVKKQDTENTDQRRKLSHQPRG